MLELPSSYIYVVQGYAGCGAPHVIYDFCVNCPIAHLLPFTHIHTRKHISLHIYIYEYNFYTISSLVEETPCERKRMRARTWRLLKIKIDRAHKIIIAGKIWKCVLCMDIIFLLLYFVKFYKTWDVNFFMSILHTHTYLKLWNKPICIVFLVCMGYHEIIRVFQNRFLFNHRYLKAKFFTTFNYLKKNILKQKIIFFFKIPFFGKYFLTFLISRIF